MNQVEKKEWRRQLLQLHLERSRELDYQRGRQALTSYWEDAARKKINGGKHANNKPKN